MLDRPETPSKNLRASRSSSKYFRVLREVAPLHPAPFPPLTHSTQVGFLAGNSLPQSHVVHSVGGSAVAKPYCVSGRFHPQKAWKSAGMKHSLDTFNNGMIEVLSHTVLTRGIVDGEFLFRASRLEVEDELLVKIFAPLVRVKDFDRGIILGAKVSFKLFVRTENAALLLKEIGMAIA